MFAHQVRADQLVFWRGRESAIFVFLFPVLLFLLLSTVYSGEYRGRPLTDYHVPTLITYGVANTTFGGPRGCVLRLRDGGLRRSGGPMYQQLRQDLLARIRRGEFRRWA